MPKSHAVPRWIWSGRSHDLGKMSLRDLAIAYSTYYAIDAYMGLAAISAIVAVRLSTGWIPAAVSGVAALVVYPFAWYLIHRFILHSRWLYKFPWAAGAWKRIHFDHHQDPHRLEVLFGALSTTLPTIAAVTLSVGWLLAGAAGAACALCVGLLTTCFYEFAHCIQHLNYKPRNAFLKRIKRWHLAHHFHNERGNYGIVSFLPDRLFRTWYDGIRDIPRSMTTFNLGYDRAEAARYPYVARLTRAPPCDRAPRGRENEIGEMADAESWLPQRQSGQ